MLNKSYLNKKNKPSVEAAFLLAVVLYFSVRISNVFTLIWIFP